MNSDNIVEIFFKKGAATKICFSLTMILLLNMN